MAPLTLVAFWASSALLAFTFAGYRVLIEWLARGRPEIDAHVNIETAPDVAVVLVAYNEERRIRERVENLLASDYPAGRLRVVVVSDGSTDATVEIAGGLNDSRVRVLPLSERRGKAAGLNAGLAVAEAEVVVLTDARQRFPRDTIARLVAHFANPQVGAVSGSLEIDNAQSAAGRGVDAYWRFEKAIRKAEARWDSCIGCTGAVYAIRRTLYRTIPEDTVLDDVVIPMQIAMQGRRVLHDSQALAYDPQPLEPTAEKRRKRRTLAGNFQMLFRYPEWLVPSRSRLWWQLLAHKYLRLAAPVMLLLAFVSSFLLSGAWLYRAAFFSQCALYACALAGLSCPRLRGRAFTLPAGFVFLNLTTVLAFWHYLRSASLHHWESARATQQ